MDGALEMTVEMKKTNVPEPVQPSFNEVNQAEQERDRLENEAWARYNSQIPRARGEAKKLIQQAIRSGQKLLEETIQMRVALFSKQAMVVILWRVLQDHSVEKFG